MMKPHARLLLLGALLLAPIVSGCTITQPWPADVQPPLTQEQIDGEVYGRYKEALWPTFSADGKKAYPVGREVWKKEIVLEPSV